MNKSAAVEPLKARISVAVALMGAGAIISRILLLASNWALGALLDDQIFGVSGLVGIVSGFAWMFVGFGLEDVLVQRGRSLALWLGTAFRFSLIAAIGLALLTALFAPVMAVIFREPRIVGPVLVVALTFPIAALSVVSSAILTSRMDFKFILGWGIIETLLTQGLTIAFAAAGFGAYSFALPGLLVLAVRAAAFAWRTQGVRSRAQKLPRLTLLLRKGSAVVGAKLLNCLVAQGDYIVLGLLATTSQVGFYYFAFRLAAAPVRTIAVSLGNVLFPAMTRLRADPSRMSEAAVKAAALLAWIATPLSYFQIAITAPALHFFFGNKWDASIPIIQLLGIGLVVEGIMAVTRSYLSASGKFDVAFGYSVTNAVGFITACFIGALLGSTNGLALGVSLFYLTSQPALFALLVDQSKRRLRNVVEIFVLPAAAAAGAFGAAWAIATFEWARDSEPMQIALITLIGWPLFFALMRLFSAAAMRQLIEIGIMLVRRRPA